MPTPIQDEVRQAMTGGGNLDLELAVELNDKASGTLDVYLHQVSADRVRVDLDPKGDGEPAEVLWLPWKQGEMPMLRASSIESAQRDTLFFTYYLSGCKVFAIRGGPVWHIDAPVSVNEFWPRITSDEWVEDNWPTGTAQNVAYLHRAGQADALWNLSDYLVGGPPTTYGAGNIGQAIVGGVVNNNNQLDLYFKASPWASLDYTEQLRKK